MNKLLFGILTATLALGACDSGGDGDKDKSGKQAKSDKGKAKSGKDAGKASADGGKAPAADGGKDGPAGKDATPAAGAEGGDEEEVSPEQIVAALDKRVRRAAKLAHQIETTPDKASEILEVAGLDRDAFEALIYEIGADPDLAQQYQVAMAQPPSP